MTNTLYSWTYPTRFEKGSLWYIVALIIVLTLVIYGIIQGVWLMSIVALLFAGVYILNENNTPARERAEITNDGIHLGTTFYDYANIVRFSILSLGNTPRTLRLHVQGSIPPVHDVPLTHDVNIAELRDILSSRIIEDPNEKFAFADYCIQMMRL